MYAMDDRQPNLVIVENDSKSNGSQEKRCTAFYMGLIISLLALLAVTGIILCATRKPGTLYKFLRSEEHDLVENGTSLEELCPMSAPVGLPLKLSYPGNRLLRVSFIA